MRLVRIFILLILLVYSNISISDPIQVIYVNGIGNKFKHAKESRDHIDNILKESRNHQENKLDFVVRFLWNPVGFNGVNELFNSELHDDYKELFILKTAEEWFSAPFDEVISPSYPINEESIVNAAGVVNNYYKDLTPGFNSLESNGIITDDDMKATGIAISELIGILKSNIDNKLPTIVVAHSQGNLLINLAYANLISRLGTDINNYVKFINIANTSKFSINNLNITHADDRALINLRTLPLFFTEAETQELSSRDTPFCNGECAFEIMEPTFYGSDADGFLKHGFTDTYTSDYNLPYTTTIGSPAFTGVDFTPGETTFRDRFEDFIYTAANFFKNSYEEQWFLYGSGGSTGDLTLRHYHANGEGYTIFHTPSINGSNHSPRGNLFEDNTLVTVVATPDEGHYFTGWRHNGSIPCDTSPTCSFIITQDEFLKATFAPINETAVNPPSNRDWYILKIAQNGRNGGWGGDWFSPHMPEEPFCSGENWSFILSTTGLHSSCISSDNPSVKITADIKDGFAFSHWEGHSECTSNPVCSFSITEDTTIKLIVAPIKINSLNPSSVTLNTLTTFTIEGRNLPDTLAVHIDDCVDSSSSGTLQVSHISDTEQTFACTPSYTTGEKSYVIKHESNGMVLDEGVITVN